MIIYEIVGLRSQYLKKWTFYAWVQQLVSSLYPRTGGDPCGVVLGSRLTSVCVKLGQYEFFFPLRVIIISIFFFFLLSLSFFSTSRLLGTPFILIQEHIVSFLVLSFLLVRIYNFTTIIIIFLYLTYILIFRLYVSSI